MVDGLGANPSELRDAASTISRTVRDIDTKDLARPAGGDAFGHAALRKAVADFCSAMETATQVLVQTAEGAGNALRDSAKTYLQQDEAAGVPLHQLRNHLPGGR